MTATVLCERTTTVMFKRTKPRLGRLFWLEALLVTLAAKREMEAASERQAGK